MLLLLAGCTTIGHMPPPDDFPKLDIIVHEVSTKEMRDVCTKYAHPLAMSMACSEYRFAQNRCDIWLDKDFPEPSILEHELEHCKGKDHMGGTYLRDLWNNYKNNRV